jgi:hypothetical protein
VLVNSEGTCLHVRHLSSEQQLREPISLCNDLPVHTCVKHDVLQQGRPTSACPSHAVQTASRADGLQKLSRCLADIDPEDQASQKAAVDIVSRLKAAGQIKGYGAGRQIPKRLYTLEELRLNRIDTAQLLSPQDTTLGAVSSQLQAVLIAAIIGTGVASGDAGVAGAVTLTTIFLGGVDEVANGGGGRALIVDMLGRILKPSYRCSALLLPFAADARILRLEWDNAQCATERWAHACSLADASPSLS